FLQAEDGIRDWSVTGVQTCALPIFIQSSPGNVGRREIARAFGIKGAGRIGLKRILKELAADGLIADARRRVRKGALPQVGVIVEIGRASCRERGQIAVVCGAWVIRG